jgi:hypothetical protein
MAWLSSVTDEMKTENKINELYFYLIIVPHNFSSNTDNNTTSIFLLF